jgi:hypothetical protein
LKSLINLLSLFLFLSGLQVVLANNSLYVFYPTDIRPNKMAKYITEYCPEINTTVFGRIKDFKEQIHRSPPDAILSYAPVIEKNLQYSSFVQGVKQGQSNEDYVLVSIKKPVALDQLPFIKIGVLDILGRKAMKSFMNKTLGTKVKISRVTKTEDILNLLSFGLVDAIFISQQRYNKFRLQSQLPLVATSLHFKMGLAVLAIKNGISKGIYANCVNQLDKQTNALLGVDQWDVLEVQHNIIVGEALWAIQ